VPVAADARGGAWGRVGRRRRVGSVRGADAAWGQVGHSKCRHEHPDVRMLAHIEEMHSVSPLFNIQLF
jgi:hypothetical protein